MASGGSTVPAIKLGLVSQRHYVDRNLSSATRSLALSGDRGTLKGATLRRLKRGLRLCSSLSTRHVDMAGKRGFSEDVKFEISTRGDEQTAIWAPTTGQQIIEGEDTAVLL